MSRNLWYVSVILLSFGCASKPKMGSREPSSAPMLCQNLHRMEIHSHRGAWDRPENMMSAFNRAISQGADFVEMDLQISKDNQIIVAHDAYMKDECLDTKGQPLPKRVYYRDMTVAQIKTYDCGSRVRAGRSVPGEKISTLAEVLAELKDRHTNKGTPLGLNIEIKYNPTQPQFYPSREFYVDRILEVIDRSGIDTSRTMIQSFDVGVLQVVRQKRASFKLSPLLGEALDGVQIAKDLKAELVTPHFGLVSPEMLSKYHENGIRVVPWTVNHPEQALQMIEWGADGIITDYPEWIDFTKRFCGN